MNSFIHSLDPEIFFAAPVGAHGILSIFLCLKLYWDGPGTDVSILNSETLALKQSRLIEQVSNARCYAIRTTYGLGIWFLVIVALCQFVTDPIKIIALAPIGATLFLTAIASVARKFKKTQQNPWGISCVIFFHSAAIYSDLIRKQREC